MAIESLDASRLREAPVGGFVFKDCDKVLFRVRRKQKGPSLTSRPPNRDTPGFSLGPCEEWMLSPMRSSQIFVEAIYPS